MAVDLWPYLFDSPVGNLLGQRPLPGGEEAYHLRDEKGSGQRPWVVGYFKVAHYPSSWRGWNGTDFSLSFVDPYLGSVSHPQEHVYAPVPYMGFVNAINVYQPGNLVVATLWDYWDNELGPPGLYLTTSTDLVHWTKPRLVITLAKLSAHDPKGSWLYAYFSLLDPAAPDLNFSIIGDQPYLYYVRLDNNDAYHRVLFRQRIKLTLNE